MPEYSYSLDNAELARYDAMAARALAHEASLWDKAGIVSGAAVVDLGCGPGTFLAALAARIAPSGTVGLLACRLPVTAVVAHPAPNPAASATPASPPATKGPPQPQIASPSPSATLPDDPSPPSPSAAHPKASSPHAKPRSSARSEPKPSNCCREPTSPNGATPPRDLPRAPRGDRTSKRSPVMSTDVPVSYAHQPRPRNSAADLRKQDEPRPRGGPRPSQDP